MTEQEMMDEIAVQTARIERVGKDFEIIKIFQTKWHSRVMFELLQKSPQRFGELQREIPGISNAVLTNVLRALADKDLISRIQFNEIPPHVEYSLTERGRGTLRIFYEMICWEKEYLPESFM